MKTFFLLLGAALVLGELTVAQMPASCTQAVIGITNGWDSSRVALSLVEKQKNGQWARILGPFPGRLGRNGTIWGLGLHRNSEQAPLKKEGDGRTPAGIFSIGGLWVTHPVPVRHHRHLPEVKVGPNDLWVSDTNTPHLYNRHVRLDHPAATPWELREQMRQRDAAHSIKLLICHNTSETPGRPVNGGGSSIFFHIWRNGGNLPTAGCTAMAEEALRAIIARLNPHAHPVYIMLPQHEYARKRKAWRLP